jgi:hypothetical protein
MKKTSLTVVAIVSIIVGHASAQSSNNLVKTSKPFARVGTTQNESVMVSVVRLGTIETATTSREKILAYPRLLPQSLDCEVTGYDFAMTANGKAWGPVNVKGAVLNEDIKDKIKDQDPSDVKISITNIRVKCGSEEVTAKPISIEYNH